MGHLAGWAAEIKAIAEGSGVAFSGALVQLDTDETISNGALTNVPWDSEVYDVGDWWSAANPTRLTVPTGVSRVIVSSNIIWPINGTGTRLVGIHKNGARFIGMGQLRHPAADNSELNVTSAVVEVTAGDFFECVVFQTSGGNLVVQAIQEAWFAIRAS